MMQKLSDYVIQFIANLGVKHIFMVPGGGAMHLNDSIGNCKDLTFVCNLHEQASAIAAEAYARITNNYGVAVVTTGPGGTNTITGVLGAWQDSTPCIFISGQVKRADSMEGLGVRQFGVQEADIVSIVKPITKYAVTVIDPAQIRYHLEKAAFLAKSDRPGPVWIDIPLDVQAAMIEPKNLESYHQEVSHADNHIKELELQIERTLILLEKSKRPVLLVGNGVRLAKAEAELSILIDLVKIPVLTTWLGLDLITEENRFLIGRPGSMAPRGANFTLQNSDLLITIGTRLDTATTGYAHDKFARAAKKVMVDIDPAEIKKMKMAIDVPIVADAKSFIAEMVRQIYRKPIDNKMHELWLRRCQEWKNNYPVVLPEHRAQQDCVSTYVFSEILSEEMASTDVLVPMSSGASIEIFFLALKVKQGQRVFHNRGTGSMGLALPQSIGAYLASERRTICIEGDGGIQLNIQELETIIRLKLPIKIFVLNNRGYSSIRASQKRYFGRLIGADSTSGNSFPDIIKVAQAYGFRTEQIVNNGQLRKKIRVVLDTEGPVLCEILLAPDEVRAPTIASKQMPDGSMVSSPLEDLWPFLDRDEFYSNMLIPVIS